MIFLSFSILAFSLSFSLLYISTCFRFTEIWDELCFCLCRFNGCVSVLLSLFLLAHVWFVWVCRLVIDFVGARTRTLTHAQLALLLFFVCLDTNIKITTNDDDKMGYVDESRSIFPLFTLALCLCISFSTSTCFCNVLFCFSRKMANLETISFDIFFRRFHVTPFKKTFEFFHSF